MKAYFNQAHQAQGTQPRALASSVLAYAENIDRLEALEGALPNIIQKHVALDIRPEHYPIVGECLLKAIEDVLGDAATQPVMSAWAEAYQHLADILIGAEEAIYQEKENLSGGWRGPRRFRVVRKEPESSIITSFYLEPVDDHGFPARSVHYGPAGGRWPTNKAHILVVRRSRVQSLPDQRQA